MRAFCATITETRQRRVTIAAEDEGAAMTDLRALFGADIKISALSQIGQAIDGRAREALDHLLSRDFFDLAETTACVETWLFATSTATPPHLAMINRKLAMAGLRVTPAGEVLIGSANSIPTLARWFRGTRWQGADLLPTLATLPAARRLNCTFAGLASRAVALPLKDVLPKVPA